MKKTTKSFIHKYVKRYFILDLEFSSFSYKTSHTSNKSQFGVNLSLIDRVELYAERIHVPPKGYNVGFIVNTEYHRFVLFTVQENIQMWINGFASILSIPTRPALAVQEFHLPSKGSDSLFSHDTSMKCKTERSYSKDSIQLHKEIIKEAPSTANLLFPKKFNPSDDKDTLNTIVAKVEENINKNTLNDANQIIKQIKLQADMTQRKKAINNGIEAKIITKENKEQPLTKLKIVKVLPPHSNNASILQPQKKEKQENIIENYNTNGTLHIEKEKVSNRETAPKIYKVVKVQNKAFNIGSLNCTLDKTKEPHIQFNIYQPIVKKVEKKKEDYNLLTMRYQIEHKHSTKPMLSSRINSIEKSDIKELGSELFSPDDPDMQPTIPSQRYRSKSQHPKCN